MTSQYRYPNDTVSVCPQVDYRSRDSSIEQLLVAGGDARLTLDPFSGLNKYGCQPLPDNGLLAFGSSTASVISTQSFEAVNRLWQRVLNDLEAETQAVVYAREISRIRSELVQLCELSDLTGLEVIFSASGTDSHTIAAQYAGSGAAMPALAVMVQTDETGSGVKDALLGRSAHERRVINAGFNELEVMSVPIRLTDGTPRQLAEIDAEVENRVAEAVALGRRVLLILVDQSKTGLIAPSPGCVPALQRRWPDQLDVLVDACQFRIAPPTLRAYLEQGCMVALTGSKFVTGPAFSAALLLPAIVAQRLNKRDFPSALAVFSVQADWPPTWDKAKVLSNVANFGLLLRWEAALEELRNFSSLPQAAVTSFLQVFAQAIQHRLMIDPHFESLPVPRLDRRPLINENSWDHLQTIFPFLLYRPKTNAGRLPLSSEETMTVYQRLPVNLAHNHDTFGLDYLNADIAAIRCQLGQPVACGIRDGEPVSALRLCLSTRLVVEALASKDNGEVVIKKALATLDKTAWLIDSVL